jgi:hypothetical protein
MANRNNSAGSFGRDVLQDLGLAKQAQAAINRGMIPPPRVAEAGIGTPDGFEVYRYTYAHNRPDTPTVVAAPHPGGGGGPHRVGPPRPLL